MWKYLQQNLTISILLIAVLFSLPLTMLRSEDAQSVPIEEPEELLPQETVTEVQLTGRQDTNILLRVLHDGTVENMPLDTYLMGVVRAEMPASFEMEALKAQATAARTYTLYKLQSGGNHGGTADICTNSTCCQAYLAEEAALENWGEHGAAYEQKIEEAVTQTDGQVILYDEEPILAVFHSSSAGLTRPAVEVWSSDLPYLQAVSSAELGETVPNYYSRVEFTAEEFQKRVLAVCGDAKFTGDMTTWLQHPETDAAGSVKAVEVGGVSMRGTQLRAALGLRSACFSWEVQSGTLVFFVTGYGHGVGLSQYGANQMARDGADWKTILLHYYTGVSVGAYRFTNDSET